MPLIVLQCGNSVFILRGWCCFLSLFHAFDAVCLILWACWWPRNLEMFRVWCECGLLTYFVVLTRPIGHFVCVTTFMGLPGSVCVCCTLLWVVIVFFKLNGMSQSFWLWVSRIPNILTLPYNVVLEQKSRCLPAHDEKSQLTQCFFIQGFCEVVSLLLVSSDRVYGYLRPGDIVAEVM